MSFFPQILVILSQFIVANWEKQRRLGMQVHAIQKCKVWEEWL